MIRCSTLHDLQCLCRQKCCTILIFQLFQFEFLATTAAKLSQKYASWEKLCIQGILNSVPVLTATLGTWNCEAVCKNFFFSVMEPYLPVRSEESGETGWSHQIALWRGCFFRDAVGSLTRAFSLHEMQIYWNKRKGLQKKGHSGPLAEISLSAQLLI